MMVPPLDVERLSPALRRMHDAAGKEGQRRMIRVTAHAPDHADRYWQFYNGMRFANSLGPRLNELIRVVAASTTECAVCFGSERKPDSGVVDLSREQVIALVDSGGDYEPRERAAMRFTYKLGTDHHDITPGDFEELHAHFTHDEIVQIGMLACQFIAMGRFSAALQLENPVCEIRPKSVAPQAEVSLPPAH